MLREFDEIEGWHGTGARSYAHWLSWRCGIGLNAAREKLRVAKALKELPEISQSFRLGEISYSKVRALTRVATPNNDSALVMMAKSGTATHVERIARGYRRAQRLQVANDIHARRELHVTHDTDGSVVIKGRVSAEAGAILVKALDAAVQSIREESTEPDDYSASRADGLARMAESFLANGNAALNGADTHLVTVQVNPEALRKSENVTAVTSGPVAHIPNGGCLSAETARRLSCDASLLVVYETTAGEPLSVGRKTRTIPPAIRRALVRRDRGCRFPGCSTTHFVDAHHVQHWADGGKTKLSNLVLLCRRHHRAVHEEGFTVVMATERIKFFTPQGEYLPASGEAYGETRYRGNAFALLAQNQRAGIEVTPTTITPNWDGEPLDLNLAVQALFAADEELPVESEPDYRDNARAVTVERWQSG